MTPRPNVFIDVVRRNVEAVQNGGDFADDFTDHTLQQGVTADKAGVRTLYGGLRAAFPDFHAEIHWQTVDTTR